MIDLSGDDLQGDNELGSALGAGVALLQTLAREPARGSQLLAEYRRQHPTLNAVVLTDSPPGSVRVEHDLHIEHPRYGSISLAWRAQDGCPWAVLYADHWAAQYVCSVGSSAITIREALIELRYLAQGEPDVLTALVDKVLIERAVDAAVAPPGEAELQAEVDRQRRIRGLTTARDLQDWLAAAGLDDEAFIAHARAILTRRKWAAALTDAHIQRHFESAREDFAGLTFVEVDAVSEEAAARLRAAARTSSAWDVVENHLPDIVAARLRRCFAFEAVAALRDAPLRLHLPIARSAPQLDPPTLAAARARLVAKWLAEQRKQVQVVWYWR